MELSCVVIIVVIYVVSIIIYLSIRQCYLLLYRNCKFEFVFSRKKITKESQTLCDSNPNTAGKVSVCGVILVCGKMWTRITQNTDILYAVQDVEIMSIDLSP